MQDMSETFVSIRGAILQSIDDVELESLDTSTSTEGENTPIASPLPMNASDFESTIYELVDKQRFVDFFLLDWLIFTNWMRTFPDGARQYST